MPPSSDGRSSAPPLVSIPSAGEPILRPEELGDEDLRVPLRLAVTRGALGLELYEPVDIGPMQISRLTLTLPGLKFPLDLSGGVPVFRNRRGDLERIELSVSLDVLARWSAPRLSEIIGPLVRPIAVWSAPPLVSFGLAAEQAALAFDLVWAPNDQSARFVMANARGMGLAAPALALALRALDALFGRSAERRGRVIEIADVGLRIGRALLPAVGARAPGAARVRFGELSAHGETLELELDASYGPPGLSREAVSALELSQLVRAADDALVEGDLDRARQGYLSALEQAPRHPDISRLVAEIDVTAGNRTEAALGMLAESQPPLRAGYPAMELLAELGSRDAAREAGMEMARVETYGPLAALVWRRLSELARSMPERLLDLDHAVARAPALPSVRRARFSARLAERDLDGALGDAEHLEALARGSRARHEACHRAARELLDAGFTREAGKLFERALRYVPSDPVATAGLGRAFAEIGRIDRAGSLLERAVTLGERGGRADPEALLDLAKLLAGPLKDLPQAIARVRQIPAAAAPALSARGLEARWRASLGDIVGASLAYARTRETLELRNDRSPEALAWLIEAARFERDVTGDSVASERHLAVALRLAPHDEELAAQYREAAALVAARVRKERDAIGSGS